MTTHADHKRVLWRGGDGWQSAYSRISHNGIAVLWPIPRRLITLTDHPDDARVIAKALRTESVINDIAEYLGKSELGIRLWQVRDAPDRDAPDFDDKP